MTRVVTFANQKGGTSKTSTVVNTAVALAQMDIRVLVIDFDPQGNASQAFGFGDLKRERTVMDFLNAAPSTLQSRGVHVIPANKDLARCESELAGNYSILNSAIGAMGPVPPDFDVILIDTPPTLGFFTLNAIVASDHVICVSEPKYESMLGIFEVQSTIKRANQKLSANCEMTGILITKFSKGRSFDKWIFDQCKENFPKLLYDDPIRTNISIAEASRWGKDVHTYKPKSNGSMDYKRFAKCFLERGWR